MLGFFCITFVRAEEFRKFLHLGFYESFGTFVVGWLLAGIGVACIRSARQLRAAAEREQEPLGENNGPPVIYLRPFAHDDIMSQEPRVC